MTNSSRITTSFNLLLFLYCLALGQWSFLLSDKAKNVPIEGIVLTSMIDLLRFTVMLFVTAYFVREIWNRLIACVFTLRNVNTQEAITVVLALIMFAR